MFELGITSSNVSADTLRALYDSNPDDELSCGVSAHAPVSESCRSWSKDQHLDGKLGLCLRLASTHVAASVFDAELGSCLDLLGQSAFAGTDACTTEYRQVVEALDEKLMVKSLTVVQMASDGVTINGLGTTLAKIDRWYSAASPAFKNDPASLSDATGRVLSAFWTRVYAVGSPISTFATGESGSDAAKTQLANLFTARLETDRQVLAAALATSAPLDEVPLLLLVADGLTELQDRLLMAAPLYDLACRIKGSCAISETNEATQLIRLIGAIGNDAALGDALTAAAGGTSGAAVRAPWRNVFTALRAQRGVLETALRKGTNRDSATLNDLYTSGIVGPAAGLAAQVSRSKEMWDRYQSHGTLLPESSILRTSLTNANVTAALTAFQDRLNALTADRIQYQKARGDLAQAVLNKITNQQFQHRINNEIDELHTEYKNLGEDLDGLMSAQDQAEQLTGKFLATYVDRATSPQWLPDYPILGHPVLLSIDATKARGSGGPMTDLASVAFLDPQDPTNPWHLDFNKGDLITFDVSGAWSPTCALRDTKYVAPNATIGFADPTHLPIGPEGFSMTATTEGFAATKHDSTAFTTESTRTSVCAGIDIKVPLTGSDDPATLNLSANVSRCREWQTGHTDSDSRSNGTQSQYAANFADGLRLSTAPFPAFPAGSLLLVEVIGTTIHDVHVVRPHSTFLFPDAGRAYLVVNDKGGCNPVDTSPLSITYVHGQSTATAARALAETMATILTTLQSSKATYIAQGSVTASELSALQKAAYDQLGVACHCNLSAFPEEVRSMFDAWLNAELASIERQTRIVAAERGLDQLVLKLKALQDDLSGATKSARLLSLMTYWQIGNLAFHLGDSTLPLRDHAESLLTNSSDMIALMRILYPQALVALNGTKKNTVDSLRTFDWGLPYDEQIMNLENMATAMKAKIDDARNSGGQSTAPLVVVFPKPGADVNVPGSLTAPAERLGGVWQKCTDSNGFCLRANPVFTFSPADVYGRALVGLGCGEASPVVQGFAVVAVNNTGNGNEAWNNFPRRGDILRAPEMRFPTEAGILSYRTDSIDAVLTPSRVRVLASSEADVASTFDMYVRKGGGDLQGVSPFNDFTIALGSEVTTASPLRLATAMVVFFDVQTRTATSSLTSIGSCVR